MLLLKRVLAILFVFAAMLVVYLCRGKSSDTRLIVCEQQADHDIATTTEERSCEFESVDILAEMDSELTSTALSFYKFYIAYISGKSRIPRLSIAAKHVLTLENDSIYIAALVRLGSLSSSFIEKEEQRLRACKAYLEQQDKEVVGSISELVDDTPCSWYTYYYWFNSQDFCHEVDIVDAVQLDSCRISVSLSFYWLDDGERHEQYYKAKEYLILCDGKWLIDSIAITP